MRPDPVSGPQVVVAGAACRDVDRADRRGWRLGGSVVYSALAMARLGLRVGAVIGADPPAARAPELDLLRIDGVDVRVVPLDQGAVFENEESPDGRVQYLDESSGPLHAAAVPDSWRDTGAWLLAPVAGELDDAWAAVPPAAAFVALGWQGLLRDLRPGARVRPRPPRPSALVARADLLAVAADDLGSDVDVVNLGALVHDGATVVLTRGSTGGILFLASGGELRPIRRYPAVRADPRDPTGAGDVFLAALVAARLGAAPRPRTRANSGTERQSGPAGAEDLRFAATAASLAVEGVGLVGVPDASAVRRRLRERLAAHR